MKTRYLWLVSPLILCSYLVACSQTPAPSTTSPASTPAEIPIDAETRLYKLTGFRDLIEFGDELVVMVYGPTTREAKIRRENIGLAEASLEAWLKESPLKSETLLRVPDVADNNGARFFYFQLDKGNKPKFIAVCAGPWKRDENPSPVICDETVETSGKIVSIEYSEGRRL